MLTPSSSAEVIPFQPTAQRWQRGEFEQRLYTWRQKFRADPELRHRTKTVLEVINDYVNRGIGAAFPSLSAIAKGGAIDRSDASRETATAIERGYLLKRPRARQRGGVNQYDESGEWFYLPALNGVALMGANHQHRSDYTAQSMLVKSGGDVGENQTVLSQNQRDPRGLSEEHLNLRKKEDFLHPNGRLRRPEEYDVYVLPHQKEWDLVQKYAHHEIGFTPRPDRGGFGFSRDQWRLIVARAAAANGDGR